MKNLLHDTVNLAPRNRLITVRKLGFCLLFLLTVVTTGWSQTADREFSFAVGLYRDGSYRSAANRFSEFTVRFADSDRLPQALFLQGECLFQLKEYGQVQGVMNRFVAQFPLHPLTTKARLRLGQAYLESGSAESAITQFKTVIDGGGGGDDIPDALYWVAEAELSLERQDNALPYYRQLTVNHPKHRFAPWAYYSIGFILEQQGKKQEALTNYKAVRENYPGSEPVDQAEYKAGNLLYQDGKYDEAFTLLNSALKGGLSDDMRRRTHFLLGEIHYKQKNNKAAVSSYSEVVAKDSISDPAEATLFAMAWIYKEENAHADAARTFERAWVAAKGAGALSPQSLYEAGVAYNKDGLTDRAITSWQKLTKFHPNSSFSADGMMETARIHYQKNRFAEAAVILNQAVTAVQSGDRAGAYRLLAAVQLAQGDEKGAIVSARRGLAEKPTPADEEELLFTVGWLSFKTGDHKSAVQSLTDLTTKYPKGTRAAEGWFYLGEAQFAVGNFTGSERSYQAVVAGFPASPFAEQALYSIAWSDYQRGNFSGSADKFDKFAKKYPSSKLAVDAELRTADSWFSIKEYGKAEDAYRKFYERRSADPERARAHYQRGVCLFKQDKFSAAIERFDEHGILFMRGEYAPAAAYMAGWSLFRMGKFAEAATRYSNMIEQYPASPFAAEAAYGRADAYYNLKDFANAVTAYETVIEKYPESAMVGEAISGIQYCAMQLGDINRALAVASKFEAEHPNSPLADDLALRAADLLYNSGEIVRAINAYKSVALKYPKSELTPSALYWQGRALVDNGDNAGAIAVWRELITTHGTTSSAAQALLYAGRAYLSLKDSSSALEMFSTLRQRKGVSDVVREGAIAEGELLRSLGRSAEALPILIAVADTPPPDPLTDRAGVEAVRTLIELKQYDQAITRGNAIAIRRTDELGAQAQFEVARAYLANGKTDEALDQFLKVKYIYSSYNDWVAQALLYAAEIEIARGNAIEAKRHLKVVQASGIQRLVDRANKLSATLP